MSAIVKIAVHPSQFPDAVHRAFSESLRLRRVNPKLLYLSFKQTRKWLRLHAAYSPWRTDPECAAAYERSFQSAVSQFKGPRVDVIGLGCGDGLKDTRLVQALSNAGKQTAYAPCDVATAMVLVARQTACAAIPGLRCFPLVCDLAMTPDLPEVLEQMVPGPSRLYTFFGMIPNFEPEVILPRLAALVRPGDALLLSANLAPGPDYDSGVRRILPLYDNTLTRDWLITFLLELGVEPDDGDLRFVLETEPATGLKRIEAWFDFAQDRTLELEQDSFPFKAGERIRLFFSYRHTPALMRDLLRNHGLVPLGEWVTPSQEEGVLLLTRQGC